MIRTAPKNDDALRWRVFISMRGSGELIGKGESRLSTQSAGAEPRGKLADSTYIASADGRFTPVRPGSAVGLSEKGSRDRRAALASTVASSPHSSPGNFPDGNNSPCRLRSQPRYFMGFSTAPREET